MEPSVTIRMPVGMRDTLDTMADKRKCTRQALMLEAVGVMLEDAQVRAERGNWLRRFWTAFWC